jgi:hypothetical protein
MVSVSIIFLVYPSKDTVARHRVRSSVPGYRYRSPGFDSRRYQIFKEVVGLERGPHSFVSTIEELLERKTSGSGLEIREYGREDLSRLPPDTLYPRKLALTSPTSGPLGRYSSLTD